MQIILIKLIQFYSRFISPLFGPCCRFYPCCSAYAEQAVSRHGAIKGIFMIMKRLCKCHPYHPGGYDPVPRD